MVRTLSKLAIGVLAAGALAIAPALAASSAQAAVTPKCTVTLTAPKTISVSTEQQLFYIDVAKGANGQTPDCVKRFQINLVRSSDNLAMWGAYWRSIQWKWTSDTDYQNGRMKWQLPAYIDFALSGTYQLVLEDAELNADWAAANGVSRDDVPKFVVTNSAVDIRHAARASFSAKRGIHGVGLNGVVTRANAGRNSLEWVKQAGATVKLQKKSGTAWVTKKTVRADSAGAFSATIGDNSSGSWRAEVLTAATHWSTASGVKPVAKKKAGEASVKVSNTAKVNYSWFTQVSTTFTGKVSFNAGGGYVASDAGVKVKVQKKQGKKWKTVKTLKTKSNGAVQYTTKKAGKYRFSVPATSKYTAKTSAVRNW